MSNEEEFVEELEIKDYIVVDKYYLYGGYKSYEFRSVKDNRVSLGHMSTSGFWGDKHHAVTIDELREIYEACSEFHKLYCKAQCGGAK